MIPCKFCGCMVAGLNENGQTRWVNADGSTHASTCKDVRARRKLQNWRRKRGVLRGEAYRGK